MNKYVFLILAMIILSVPLAGLTAPATQLEPSMDDESGLMEGDAAEEDSTTAPEESSGLMQTLRDASITASIKTKMMVDGDVDALSINVDTENQVVTLNGEVDTPEQISLAQELAWSASGVVAVNNYLKVRVMTES